MSQTSIALTRGEKRSQQIRPATIKYGTAEMPCTPGNHDFFDILRGGGFVRDNDMPVKILRADIPEAVQFHSGQDVTVKEMESGDVFDLKIGRTSTQAALVILWLEGRNQ